MELTGCDILAHCWRTYDAFWLPWSSISGDEIDKVYASAARKNR